MDNKEYQQGIARLVLAVRGRHVPLNTNSERKKIETFAERLDSLVQDLNTKGTAQTSIQQAQNDNKKTGLNGYPMEDTSYVEILGDMKLLAESARWAADRLPDSRRKLALPFAAMGLLHLAYMHGQDRPKLHNESPTVIELESICQQCGIVLSRETLRAALSFALENFEPAFTTEYQDILGLSR